jgi:hypothetical protein
MLGNDRHCAFIDETGNAVAYHPLFFAEQRIHIVQIIWVQIGHQKLQTGKCRAALRVSISGWLFGASVGAKIKIT